MQPNPQARKQARSNGKDVYSGEIMPLLNRPEFRYRSAVASFYSVNEPNSADVYVLARESFAIEIKTGHDGVLSMASEGGWRPTQQEWAIRFEAEVGIAYWLAVIFETPDTPWKSMLRKSSGKGKLPRAAFLVPLARALAVKEMLPTGTFPYLAKSGMSLITQANHLDAVTLWSDLQLEWNSGWTVNATHPFSRYYSKENNLDHDADRTPERLYQLPALTD